MDSTGQRIARKLAELRKDDKNGIYCEPAMAAIIDAELARCEHPYLWPNGNCVTCGVFVTSVPGLAEGHTVVRKVAELARERDAGWVSVKERLPGEQGQDSEDVLCFLTGHCGINDFEKRGDGGWGIMLGFYDAEKGHFRCGGRVTPEVTHWRPLPAPPACGS